MLEDERLGGRGAPKANVSKTPRSGCRRVVVVSVQRGPRSWTLETSPPPQRPRPRSVPCQDMFSDMRVKSKPTASSSGAF